jgi:RNA polymerase sigma-70 factor, ECF subfamily
MELMMQVRSGSAHAFEAIVARYWESTVRYAVHLAGDPDQARDVVQEAFTRLWQRRQDWESRGSVQVWLLRTTRNRIVGEVRRQSVRSRWAAGAGQEGLVCPPTPLQEMERTELREAIRLAIRQLSPRRREVFTLFQVQGLSYREIAEIMDIRPQTVANYLQAAVAELRLALHPFLNASSVMELRGG